MMQFLGIDEMAKVPPEKALDALEERRYTVVDDTVELNRLQRRALAAKKRKAKNKRRK